MFNRNPKAGCWSSLITVTACDTEPKCRRKFARDFSGIHPPSKSAIYEIAKKFHETGSVLDKKPESKHHVLNEEKLNKISIQLEVSPQKLSYLAAYFLFS